jgi:hypothetical protein
MTTACRAVLALILCAILFAAPASATVGTTTSSTTIQGNSSTTNFTYNFDIPNQSPVPVVVSVLNTTVTPNVTTFLSPTQYTITGLGNSSGGTVVYPLVGSPIAPGYFITVARNLPIVQTTSICGQGPTYCAIEHALDYLTYIAQQLQTQISVILTEVGSAQPVSIAYVENIAALRANTGLYQTLIAGGYYTASDNGGGTFVLNGADNSSLDNGGTIIVDVAGHRYYRQYDGKKLSILDYGAKCDGITDDHAAINNALASGAFVTGVAQATCFVGSAGITNTNAITYFDALGATVTFSGTSGAALYGTPVSNKYPALYLNNLAIITTGAGATCFDFKFSSSEWHNDQCVNQASNSEGLLFDTDLSHGSGPYYNKIYNYQYNGNVGNFTLSNNQPFKFVTGSGGQSNSGPNFNLLDAGNISDYDTAPLVAGESNSIRASFQNWHANGATNPQGYAIIFDNPNYVSLGTGNAYNTLLTGSYFEGDNSSIRGVDITAHALYPDVGCVQIGSLGGGASVTDASQSTNYECGPGSLGVAWTFTPTLVSSGGGTPTYAANGQVGAYSVSGGDLITFTASIVTSAVSGLSAGTLTIPLPPPYGTAANIGTNQNWGCALTQAAGITLDSGYTQIGGTIVNNGSAVLVQESGSGRATQQLSVSNLSAATTLQISCQYRRA